MELLLFPVVRVFPSLFPDLSKVRMWSAIELVISNPKHGYALSAGLIRTLLGQFSGHFQLRAGQLHYVIDLR